LQFANVEQSAAALFELVCSSKPLLHECVASTAPVDAYERSALLKKTIPFVSAAIESHFAAVHVGATPLHPLFAHPSDAAPMSTYPLLHVNVAVEPCVFPLLRTGALPFSGALSDEHDSVGAALGAELGIVVGAEDGAVLGIVVGAEVGASVQVLAYRSYALVTRAASMLPEKIFKEVISPSR
tara:strand:+ start:296 stop:844 length:549 start_codon:yes stop_codon:yes gene_type:complete